MVVIMDGYLERLAKQISDCALILLDVVAARRQCLHALDERPLICQSKVEVPDLLLSLP